MIKVIWMETKRDICPECGEECFSIERESSFSFSGTHVTGGRSGVAYYPDHGKLESDCCHVLMEEI